MFKRDHCFQKNLVICVVALVVLIAETGCKKLIAVDSPYTSITSSNVYNSDQTAIGVLTGIYNQLSACSPPGGYGSNGLPSFSFYGALSADEFTLWNGISDPAPIAYYQNNLSALNAGFELWNALYSSSSIYACNAAIEGLSGSTGLTPAVKQQLLGEAYFMRAFFYFYLVNLYGDVPLLLNTDFKSEALMARTPKAQVYQQIIIDLKSAASLLSYNFVSGSIISNTNQRVRPTKWAAFAMLARTYLYTNDYPNAEANADSVINNSTLFSIDSLNNVFLANSTEAIWQLQPVSSYPTNTEDAVVFIIPSTGFNDPQNPVYLSSNLMNSFEFGDERRQNWVDSVIINDSTYYYPYKYKVSDVSAPVTEYLMMLRLGEQYLIRAEARENQGNIQGAESDLNVIRTRAGLPNTTAVTQQGLLSAILHERQIELFTEMGHRWLDIKRTGTVDSVMSIVTPEKGGTWSSPKQLYPLPQTDLILDPNLVQNESY